MRFSLFIICMLFVFSAFTQVDIKGVCKISNNRLNFYLDTKWTDKEKAEISKSFDLDSALIEIAFELNPSFVYDSVEWQVKKINNRIIELSKDLNLSVVASIEKFDFELFDIESIIQRANMKGNTVIYGANDFKNTRVFKYKDSTATFYLPGYKDSKKVMLSGSFNEWSTLHDPMQRVDSGWILNIALQPGKYIYKYIVDGNWMIDPNNQKKEQNEHGTYNSVVFCYNHIFTLKGYRDKKKVIISGSFNNWNEKELKMRPVKDGWELPIWLKEGTHTYKYIVNNQWMIDSMNPLVRDDGKGNKNSVLELGETHTFFLEGYTDANRVILTGSFNNWDEQELRMNKTDSGWVSDYTLGPGIYEYKFIADGIWMFDKNNPYTKGEGTYTNSVLIFKPNHTFVLNAHQNASHVSVTGTFNNWDPRGFPMQKLDGKWVLPAYLEKGKQLYKFIIDGEWIIDPDNPLWEENQYGTGNSVLWIE